VSSAELHSDLLAIHPDFIAVCYRTEKCSQNGRNCEAGITAELFEKPDATLGKGHR
jgi:hypothetical protein